MNGTFSPVEFADFIRSRWRLPVIATIVSLVLTLVVTSLIPRRYTATASILIGSPAGNDPRAATSVNAVYLESLKAYERLALSDTILARAIETLKIEELRTKAVESFKRDVVKVTKPPNTAILEVQATLKDPRQAQALAQYIAEQTVELSKSINARSATDASRDLRDQVLTAQGKLEKARQARDAFALAEPVEALDAELRNNVDLKSKLDRDLTVARTDLAGMDVQESTREVSALRARIAAIESQQHQLAETITQQSAQLARRKSRGDALDADRQSAQYEWDDASAKLRDAAPALSNRGERLQIIDPGIVPRQPSYPNTFLNILAALLVALAGSTVALALAFSYSGLANERSVRAIARRQRHDIDLPIPS